MPEFPRHPQDKNDATRKRMTADRAVLVLLLLGLMLQAGDVSIAREPLKGSATVTQSDAPLGEPYYPQNPTVRKADEYARDWKLGAAEELYRQVLRQYPRNPGAWNGIGKVTYYRTTSSNQNLRDQVQDMYDEAIQHFMTALRYEPDYVEARVNLASIYMEMGRYGDADAELERALDLAPQDDLALAKKGELLVRQQRPNEAVPYLKQSIRLRSNQNPSAHYYLGVAYTARNQIDEALEELQVAQYQDPNNASVQYQMGSIYEKQGNAAAAVEHYQQALRLKPEYMAARRKLASYYEKRGDTSAAMEHYRTLSESGDNDWQTTDRIGRLALQNGQPSMAVRAYRGWLNAHPDDPQAKKALSYAKTQLAKEKRRDDDLVSQGEAKRYAEQAIRYNPNNMEARLVNTKLDREMGVVNPVQTGKEPGMVDVALTQPAYHPYQSLEKGMLYLSRYQFQEAYEAFEAARRTADTPREQMILGELLLTKSMPALAEESFKQVLRDMPNNNAARLGLAKAREERRMSRDKLLQARVYGRNRSVELGIHTAEEALKHNIASSDAHFLLGALYESKKNYMQAADHYYAYLQLNPKVGNRQTIERKISWMKGKLAEAPYKYDGR